MTLTARLGYPARLAALAGLAVIAYHASLRALVDALALDTPLAYLGLVPPFALGIGLAAARAPNELDIHDRQVDFTIGLPLIASAVIANIALPPLFSAMFWVWRVDLLTLPFFVAGAVVLLFGSRTAWRARWAILFLFLAWPLPYTLALIRWLESFTGLTLATLRASLRAVPIATNLPGGDGSLFAVSHASRSIVLSVASACSGANSLVGFLLVGLAFQAVVEGRPRRRLAWLAAGGLLVWALNVVRILLIFAAARLWGERAAIQVIHPYIGLIFFFAAVGVMVATMRRFGLRFRTPGGRGGEATAKPYRPKWRLALAGIALAALVLGAFNGNLREAQALATSQGTPRLASFDSGQGNPEGWQRSYITEYQWAKRFFGQDSNWRRYSLLNDGTGRLTSSLAVTADVITTSRLSALSYYGVEACYRFHEYRVMDPDTVDLGNGLVGGVLTWSNPEDGATWTSLYWHWPTKTATGTRYERVTLLLHDSKTAKFSVPKAEREPARQVGLRLANSLQDRGGDRASGLTPQQRQARSFLVAFGKELAARRAPA